MKCKIQQNLFSSLLCFSILVILSSCSAQPSNNGERKADNSGVGMFSKIALASLYSSKQNNKISKISDFLSGNSQCISGNDPTQPPKQWDDLIDNLKKQGVIGKAVNGTDLLNQQQRMEAWQLLVSGRTENDVRVTIESLISTLAKINPTRLRDQLNHIINPRKDLGLLGSLLIDLNPAIGQSILSNTIETIKKEPVYEVVADAALIFTNKDNRSMRLAIIAYAHMNGININEENIDDLNSFLDKNNSNLNPLLEGAIDSLKQEYEINDAKQVLDKIKANENACKS
jgi:hypothetical protein